MSLFHCLLGWCGNWRFWGGRAHFAPPAASFLLWRHCFAHLQTDLHVPNSRYTFVEGADCFYLYLSTVSARVCVLLKLHESRTERSFRFPSVLLPFGERGAPCLLYVGLLLPSVLPPPFVGMPPSLCYCGYTVRGPGQRSGQKPTKLASLVRKGQQRGR